MAFRERSTRVAFLLSIGIHSLLLTPFGKFAVPQLEVRPTKIEVTYIKAPEPKIEKALRAKNLEATLKKELPKEIKAEKAPEPRKAEAAAPEAPSNGPSRKKIVKKMAQKKRARALEQSEERPAAQYASIDLSRLSEYRGESDSLNYLRAIRNKIRQSANRNYRTAAGEGFVYCEFVLGIDGSLRYAKVIDERSTGNEPLRKISLTSIREAAPFGRFPRSIDLAFIKLLIPISFKR